MKTLKQNSQVKRIKSGISLAGIILIIQSCSSVAPVTTSVESARMVEKGKIEGAVMYSSYSTKMENYNGHFDANGNYYMDKSASSMQTMNNNYGFRVIAGGENNNMGFHYERMCSAQDDYKVNYFAFEPKFKLNSDKNMAAAFSVPLGIYVEDESQGSTIFQLMPAFHFTYGGSKYFEFSFSPKAIFFLNNFPSIPLFNMTAGFGLSSDLKMWAVRPEIGYTISPSGGSGILQTAVGLSLNFGN